jgi:hypothetical protein
MWRKGCRAATQREARQPIGSSSTRNATAHGSRDGWPIVPWVTLAGRKDFGYMLTDFRSNCLGPEGRR